MSYSLALTIDFEDRSTILGKKSSERTFDLGRFRGWWLNLAELMSLDVVFTRFRSYSLGLERLLQGRCRFFVDFWKLVSKEKLAGSKY